MPPSADNTPRSSNLWKVSLGVVVLVGIGISALIYSYTIRRADTPLVTLAGRAANDLDSVEAIRNYEELLDSSASKTQKAEWQAKLGYHYIVSDDYKRGVDLSKEIIEDETLPGDLRANTLAIMANGYYRARDKEILSYIMQDDGIYAEALAGGSISSSADLEDGLHRLYEMANEWHPLSYLEYTIAFHNANQLLDNPQMPAGQQKALIADVLHKVELGDELLAAETAVARPLLWPLQLHFRMYDLTAIARFDSSYQAEAEEAFEKMMAYCDTNATKRCRSIQTYTRFYYAAYLADTEGEAATSRIRELTRPLTGNDNQNLIEINENIYAFFENELTRPKEEQNHNTRFIVTVAKYDPDFNSLLVSRGWKEK